MIRSRSVPASTRVSASLSENLLSASILPSSEHNRICPPFSLATSDDGQCADGFSARLLCFLRLLKVAETWKTCLQAKNWNILGTVWRVRWTCFQATLLNVSPNNTFCLWKTLFASFNWIAYLMVGPDSVVILWPSMNSAIGSGGNWRCGGCLRDRFVVAPLLLPSRNRSLVEPLWRDFPKQ